MHKIPAVARNLSERWTLKSAQIAEATDCLSSGNDTITGAAAADNLNGGAGNNVFDYGNGEFIAAETVTGGANTDTINFTADDQTVVDAQFTNKTQIEAITTANGTNSITLGTNAAAATATLTVVGGTGADTFDASALGEAVRLQGEGGANVLTGSNQADTIVGGSGDDTITGGAGGDDMTGFTGNNVFIFNTNDVAAGEAVVLLGTDTFNVVTTTVFDNMNAGGAITGIDDINISEAQSAEFLSAQLTGLTLTVDGVAGGVAETLKVDASLPAGANVINLANATLTNAVSSITGGTVSDTITGTNANDTITGGTGADALDGGAGSDEFVQADGSSVIWTAQTGVVGNAIAAGGVFTFGNSTDVITNFVGGAAGDDINVNTANNLTTLAATDATNGLVVGNNYLVRGAWNAGAGTFTQADAGADALILFDAQNAAFENAANDNFIVATGVGATLVAANFT